MKTHAQAVVIGGGVIGCSILYHLAKLGWKDVVLLERDELTSGSTWHAAAGIHGLHDSANISRLQHYTMDLYNALEAETGQSCGVFQPGSLYLAQTDARVHQLRLQAAKAKLYGMDFHEVSRSEAERLHPLVDFDGIKCIMWEPSGGNVDPSGVTHAYTVGARQRGAEVHRFTPVTGTVPQPDGTWVVETPKGDIRTDWVINAAGLWAKQLGRMAGIELPVSPLKHHYLISDTIPALEGLDFEVPMTVDLEGFTYLRQDQKGVLLGIYEIEHEHWAMDGAPWNYGMELFQEQTDRIENELILGCERYPALQDVGVKTWVNGAFTFSPDGNPLVGPVPGKRGYWSACAVMAGFLQGGGVGKSLAEWMIHGEPEADVYGMDVARYGVWAENKQYIKETTGQFYTRRFVMTYPNEQLPAGRPIKCAPAHSDMTAAGARWGQSWDLEVPLYFAEPGFEEPPSLKRSNAFDIVARECKAVREGVGLLDISGFSRFEVSGDGAEDWLNTLFATKLPKPGRARLAVALGDDARLKGDLTLFNWGDGTWWTMGSYYLRTWHMRWFNDHMGEGVHIRDLGEEMAGFSLSGPKSRAVIEKLTDRKSTRLNSSH